MIQLEGDCLKVIRVLQVASPTLIRLGPLWTSVFPFPLHLLLFRLCMFLGPAIHLRICLLSLSLLHVMKARTFLHVALKTKKKKITLAKLWLLSLVYTLLFGLQQPRNTCIIAFKPLRIQLTPTRLIIQHLFS